MLVQLGEMRRKMGGSHRHGQEVMGKAGEDTGADVGPRTRETESSMLSAEQSRHTRPAVSARSGVPRRDQSLAALCCLPEQSWAAWLKRACPPARRPCWPCGQDELPTVLNHALNIHLIHVT